MQLKVLILFRYQKQGGQDNMDFSEKLLTLRKANDMTQEQLAEKLDISRHEPVIIRLNQEKPINWGFALIQS